MAFTPKSPPQQHQTIKERGFPGGIDQRSAESDIAAGFIEDAVNVNVVQGRLRKRAGYEPFGQTPVSVKYLEVDAALQTMTLTFPESVDLTNCSSVPIIISGIVETNVDPNTPAHTIGGDFTTTTNEVYYPIGKPLTTVALPASAHSATILGSTLPYLDTKYTVSVYNQTNGGNELIFPELQIVEATRSTIINYTTPIDLSVYVSYANRTTSYVHTFTGQAAPYTILAATHNQNSANLRVEVWYDDGTNLNSIVEPAVLINTANAAVTVTLPNDGLSYRVIITGMDYAHDTGEILLEGATSLSIPVQNAPTPYMMPACYVINALNTLEKVWPDTIVYNKTTNTHTISFVNLGPNAYAVRCFYEYGTITSNKMVITTPVVPISYSYKFTSPQLVVYGLLNDNIYIADGAGVSNEIDSYRREGDDKIVTSVGGNLFVAQDSQITLPSLQANLSGRVVGITTLAPCFWQTGTVSTRTAGYVTADSVDGSNALPCTAAKWLSGNLVQYTMSAPGLVFSVPTALQVGDLLSVSQCSNSALQGDFPITSITKTATTLVVVVTNNAVNSVDYDDLSLSALAAVYTDRITMGSSTLFIAGDTLSGGNLALINPTVISNDVSTGTVLISNVTETVPLPAALKVIGTRVASVMSLKSAAQLSTTGYLVAGDVLDTGVYALFVNTAVDQSVVPTTGNQVSVTSTSAFAVGNSFVIAGVGICTVVSIDDPTTMTLDNNVPITSLLLGKTVQVNAPLIITDSAPVVVVRRFVPTFAPASLGTLAKNSYPEYFQQAPVIGAAPIRSAMSANNLYLTNSVDPVFKYDGANLYQASLPNWVPMLYTQFIPDALGSFGKPNQFATTQCYIEDSYGSNRLTVISTTGGKTNPTDVNNFKPGDTVLITNTTQASVSAVYASVIQVETSPATIDTKGVTTPAVQGTAGAIIAGYIYLDRAIPTYTIGGVPSPLITKATSDANGVVSPYNGDTLQISVYYTYKYYMRLNMVDRNNNIIASAAVGSDDLVVTQGVNGKVYIRMAQPPVYGVYPYDRIEISVYRTEGNGAVFKRVVSIPVTFNQSSPYIDFTDTYADSSLSVYDPISVILPTAGEVPTQLHGAPQAKYMTAFNNSLVLAGITSEPQFTMTVDAQGTPTLADFENATFIIAQLDAVSATPNTTTPGAYVMEYKMTSALVPSTLPITTVSGVSFTVHKTAHGLSIGDWVYIPFDTTFASTADMTCRPFTGYWQINSKTNDTFTILCTQTPDYATMTTTQYVFVLPIGGANATIGATYTNNTKTFTVTKTITAGGSLHLGCTGTGAPTVSGTLTYAAGTGDAAISFNSYVLVPTPSYAKAGVTGAVPVYIGIDLLQTAVAGYGTISSSFPNLLAMSRLSQAINFSMRAVDTTIAAQSQFTPWLLSAAGGSYSPGEIVLSETGSFTDGFTVTRTVLLNTLNTVPYPYSWFSNGTSWLDTASLTQVSVVTELPSRLLVSYQNYPELFSNPYAPSASDSDSAIDINPADGQAITGVIPFFGATTFGAALQGSVLLVFKQNSLYLVDPSAKARGDNPIQKVESNGIGCTCPYSISVSRSAIVFASEAGIYGLRPNLALDWVGQYVDRIWQEQSDRGLINTLATGHHDPIGKSYKISYPMLGDTENSGVLVYNHSQEDQVGSIYSSPYPQVRIGAWTRYTNYPATGWANLNSDEFFATTKGWVFQTRNSGTSADFADLGRAIESNILLRGLDFGDSGMRKQVRHIIAHYRPITSLTSVSMSEGVDFAEQLLPLDTYRIIKAIPSTDLSDLGGRKIITLAHSPAVERGVFFQIQVMDNGLNEGIDFIGVDFTVILLSHHGIADSSQTMLPEFDTGVPAN